MKEAIWGKQMALVLIGFFLISLAGVKAILAEEAQEDKEIIENLDLYEDYSLFEGISGEDIGNISEEEWAILETGDSTDDAFLEDDTVDVLEEENSEW